MVKLLVIGWDGADDRHLDRIQPDLYASLQHNGNLVPEPVYRGIPIDSGTAWTTITTGLPVEKHGFLSINNVVESRGILNWTKQMAQIIPTKTLRTYFFYGMNKLFNLKERTPRSHDVPYKRLWDYLDGRSLTVEVPLTFPAQEHNGVLLSGIPAPTDTDEATWPRHYHEYRERYEGYDYITDGQTPLEGEDQPNKQEYIDRIYELNEEAIEVVGELCEEEAFELVFAVFPIIDDLLHALDPEDEWEQIKDAYKWLDDQSQQLIDRIDPDTVLIISDHGMMPAAQSLNPHQYPGLKMDHDSMHGIWASDHDFGLEQQLDVTPAILDYFGQEFEPKRKTSTQSPDIDDITV